MIISPRSLSRRRLTMLVGTLLLLHALVSIADSSSSSSLQQQQQQSCQAIDNSSQQQQFTCPNCGGMQVNDCLGCDGYAFGDRIHHVCIRRVLFQSSSNPSDLTDHTNHNHYIWNDILGMLVWFVTAAIAISAGVGGGGIYVPLGILLFQFAPKQASGLSQASVFGASLGGLLVNIKNHHPNEHIRSDAGQVDDKDKTDSGRTIQSHLTSDQQAEYAATGGLFYKRPLIHYDMALFLAPMEMAGAVLGVLVQKVLPNWLYLLLAGIILGITSYKTYIKFFAARKAEIRLHAGDDRDGVLRATPTDGAYNRLPIANGNSDDEIALSAHLPVRTAIVAEQADELMVGLVKKNSRDDETDTAANHFRLALEVSADEERLQRLAFLENDSIQYPARKIAALGVLWIGLLILTLMKGGKGMESIIGITCQSPWYIILIFVQFAWLLGFSCFFGRRLHQDQAARMAVRYPYMEDDPQWDGRNIQLFGVFTFFAGVVAGLIGVGGGMVLGPLMIEMGVNPRVSSATTATMIVLTASSVVFIVLTSGILDWSYAVFYFWVCFAGALYGKSQIDAYVKSSGKSSVIIFILATIIAAATVGCLVIMVMDLQERHWCLDGLNPFCAVSSKDGKDCPANRLLGHVTSSIFAAHELARNGPLQT